jgi:hypothetical protein
MYVLAARKGLESTSRQAAAETNTSAPPRATTQGPPPMATGQCSRRGSRTAYGLLPLPPSTRSGMTVLSSSGETLPQRSARREAAVRSQWSVLVKNQHRDFQERWLASAQAPSASSSSTHRPLRSLHYATSLASFDPSPSTWASRVKKQRIDYARKRRKVLRAPDGTLPEGIEEDTADQEQSRSADWTVNNPLSLDEQVRDRGE